MRYLEATVILAVVLPTVLFAIEAVRRYDDSMDRARVRLSNDVEVAAQHALRVFDTTDVLLGRTFDLLGQSDDASVRSREQGLHEELKRVTAPLPHVQSLWAFDSEGNPLVNNRFFPVPKVNVSDREYFQWHRAGHASTYVTEALVARVGGEQFFDVSKRRVDESGKFGGLITVSLRPEHFSRFYKEIIGDRQDGRIALFKSDGRYVARWPALPPQGTRLSANSPLLARWSHGESFGVHDADSLTDGSARLGAFRQVGEYPLYIYASVPRDAVVAAWRSDMAMLAAFVAPVSLLLAWIAWVARQRTREHLLASRRLEAETAQRLRVEETLRQAQKLEAMGRLTGGVAHDFNNLLAVVDNGIHLLMMPNIADAQKAKALERIARAVASGSALTRQLLSFTRQQALRPEVLSLQERIPAMADMLQTALGGSIESVISVAPDTLPVEVDFAELELALLNLAVNSKDATSSGGRVTLTARSVNPGEQHKILGAAVVIEFSDDGRGIDPALLDRVFEPFFTTKAVGKGTGLGLSQVHGFCARANGVATVASALGKGTTFRLYLPAAAPGAVPAVQVGDTAAPNLNCRVLLVDDNMALAHSIRPMLESVGCTVNLAASVKDAVELLSKGQVFDIVLSDIVMPGHLDGVQFAEALRRGYPDLPVVLMTGYSSQLTNARNQGFVVLPKPCSPKVLVETLARQLRLR